MPIQPQRNLIALGPAASNNRAMIHWPNPTRLAHAVSIFSLAFLSPVFAAEFKPAPQEFRQEVSRQWALPVGVPASGFTVVDVAPDGAVLVTDGTRWHALRNDRLEVLASPQNAREGDGWILAGTARTVPVPLAGIRQGQRQGDVAWLATAKGIVCVSASGQASTEFADHDVRQVASGPDNLVLAATARGLWRRGEYVGYGGVGVRHRAKHGRRR